MIPPERENNKRQSRELEGAITLVFFKAKIRNRYRNKVAEPRGEPIHNFFIGYLSPEVVPVRDNDDRSGPFGFVAVLFENSFIIINKK